jgi:HTH-like domain
VKYAAIADWADEKQYSVTFMCDQLGVTRQGYYRWRAAGPCRRERTDVELTEAILAIHTELDGHPGARRIWAELIARGLRVGPTRVWRLMRAAGLRGRHPRAWKKTTPQLNGLSMPLICSVKTVAPSNPTGAGAAMSPTCARSMVGSTPRLSSICIRARWWATR